MGLDYLEYMDYFGLPRSGVIHVGANNASEARFYAAYGSVPIAFFEPIPSVYQKALQNTKNHPNMHVFHACCTDRDGDDIEFKVSSNRGMSSSIFELGRHGQIVPGVTYTDVVHIKSSKVETLLENRYRLDDFNLAVIDTQGADLLVLKGLGKFMNYLDAVYVEVSDTPLYSGGATFDEIYRYMDDLGFNLAMMKTTNTDWGNAFFKRRKPTYIKNTETAVSKGKPSRMSSQLGEWGPELGNDGDIVRRRKFFHTRKEERPWWEVDLTRPTAIKEIYLFDRPGQEERVKTLIVEVSKDGANYTELYNRNGLFHPDKRKRQAVTRIEWKGEARFVRARLDEENFLHLRQVAVVEDEFATSSKS